MFVKARSVISSLVAASALMFGVVSPVSAGEYAPLSCNAYSAGIEFGPTSNGDFYRNNFCLQKWQDGVLHKFVFQSDGNLVFYKNNVARWQSGTSGNGWKLAFQFDGNMVIYNLNNVPLWQSGTSGSANARRALTLAVAAGNPAANYYAIAARLPDGSLRPTLWASSS